MTIDPPTYYLPTPAARGSDPSPSTSIADLLAQRLDSLRAQLRHIEAQHTERTQLSTRLRHDLESAHCTVRSALLNQPDVPPHDARRSLLENRLALLDAEARRESVACWQDHAALQREWRQWTQQHAELAQRLHLLQFPTTRHHDGA